MTRVKLKVTIEEVDDLHYRAKLSYDGLTPEEGDALEREFIKCVGKILGDMARCDEGNVVRIG